MPALKIDNIVKRHGTLETLSDVSLSIEAGERVALLGHNGAGKTTLIKIVLGLMPKTAGDVEVLGHSAGSAMARKYTGYLPESVAFHGALTGREQLHHFARLKSTPSKLADDLLERVGLAHAADRKIRTYSKGMRQRIGLAQVVLGQPKLAILDEPTSGLDPVSRHEFYDIVEELAKNGTAVMLSSHALTELELRTDRIAILSAGRLVANDSLQRLREKASLPIKIKISAAHDAIDGMKQQLGGERVNGQSLELVCAPEKKMGLLSAITALGPAVKDVDVTPASLEELYRYFSAAKGVSK